MYLYRVAVVRSGICQVVTRKLSSSLKFHQLVVFCSHKSQDNLNHFKSHFMYVRKRVICEKLTPSDLRTPKTEPPFHVRTIVIKHRPESIGIITEHLG
jgi:hypothetical protein